MQLARAVDGNADQELIFKEEFCPRIVEQDAIGLEGVGDLLAVGIFLLDLDEIPEIIDTQQRRFPALPGKIHHRRIVRLDILPDVALQHIFVHRPLIDMRIGLRIQQFLFEIEAVFAVEIADRPDGLSQHVEVCGAHHWTSGNERPGKTAAISIMTREPAVPSIPDTYKTARRAQGPIDHWNRSSSANPASSANSARFF